MTDDIMTRVREWLASCVRVATENGVPEEADLEAAALAFIDGEPARLAAAREEQREACARFIHDEYYYQSASEAGHDDAMACIRATPLTTTPLADEIAALRARVAELEAREALFAATAKACEKAEARVAELEGANRYLTERVDAAGELLEQCEAAEAERDAAREAAERIVKTQWRMPDCYITATAILRAMDEAKP